MFCLPLTLLTALRFSRGRLHTNIVSLVSAFSIIGIALGVAVLIIGLSAMNGFERELKSRILSVVPHGHIDAIKSPYQNWHYAETVIRNTPGVKAVTPYIAFTGLLEHGVDLKAIRVIGIFPERASHVSTLPKFILNNAWQYFKAGHKSIILGKGIANSLHVKVKDWITITIPNANVSLNIQQPKRIRLQVSGIFCLSGLLDYQLALIPLEDAQEYLCYGKGITGFEIKAENPFNADKVVYDAGMKTMHHVMITSWMKDYGYMYNDIQIIRSIIYLALILVISVACFNIVSTLVMAIKDKRSDIAILRTIGAKDKQIRAIFLWYGLLNSSVGSMLGAVLGIVISLNLTNTIKGLEYLIGHTILSGDIYFIDFLPAQLKVLNVVFVLLITAFLSWIASWYPAHRAKKLDPARILNYK
ncbi:Lipoprotein-releasing system transmembrane protein LolE [Candidatus Hartigia pinicola]|nr:Lipoprotein-releasing system transmembrane protein LolE [Candidatus Hartigia pinicola]